MKQIFFVLLLSSALSACASHGTREPNDSKPRFSEVVLVSAENQGICEAKRGKIGQACQATWANAVAYCKGKNSHLPTAREYADHLRPFGTVILEKAEVKEGKIPAGYYLVDSINPGGQRDTFYMNHGNYRRPKEDRVDYLLWTASVPPGHPEYAHVYYNEWGGGGGDPKDHRLSHPNAFQCVSD